MPPVTNGDAQGIPLVFQNFFESCLPCDRWKKLVHEPSEINNANKYGYVPCGCPFFPDKIVIIKAVCVNTLKKNPCLIILPVSNYSQIMNFRCSLQIRLIFILQEQA